MKFGRSVLAAAFLSGPLGMAPSVAPADEVVLTVEQPAMAWQRQSTDIGWRDQRANMDSPHERYPKKIEDDSSLAPGVPGITEENTVGRASDGALMVEEALAGNGYDPGSVDGVVDLDTRQAIREFQRDNSLVVTGNVDRETASLLDIPIAESA
jgi:putative peptidoglycan binding protein